MVRSVRYGTKQPFVLLPLYSALSNQTVYLIPLCPAMGCLVSYLASYHGQCRRQTTTDSVGEGSNAQIVHSLWHPTIHIFLDTVRSNQHKWNASFHNDSNFTHMVAMFGCASQFLCQLPSHCVLSGGIAALLWSCRNIWLLPGANPTSCCQTRRKPTWYRKEDYEAVAVKYSLPFCCCPASLYLTWFASVWKATVIQDQVIFSSLYTGCHSRISYSLLLHLLPDICTL